MKKVKCNLFFPQKNQMNVPLKRELTAPSSETSRDLNTF